MGTSAPSVQMVRRTLLRLTYKYIQEQIVKHKGGLVQDFELQFKGCSKRKRKVAEASRLYTPPPEIAAVMAARRKTLRAEVKCMLGN